MENFNISSSGENSDLFTHLFFFFLIFKNLFILFIFGCIGSSLMRWLSLVAASRGYSLLLCAGFSLRWLLLLQSTGSRCANLVAVASGLSSCGLRALERRLSSLVHGLSCSEACGIFPDQGSNLCPLHWQTDS